MKKIILSTVLFFMVSVVTAHADYTIELKNEGGSVLKTYTVTTNQVAHLQKKATRTGVSVIKQFESAIIGIIRYAKIENVEVWAQKNEAYIEEQARQ